MKKIIDPALAQRVAQQVAATTGIAVTCGSAKAVLPNSERDAFRA